MLVRPAVRGELERVNELREAVNQLHVEGRPDIFRPGFDNSLRQHLYTQFDDADHAVLVAEEQGKICGFATVRLIERPANPFRLAIRYAEVEELGVDQQYQRRGIGRALIEGAKAYAREHGVRRLELNMWSFNENALAFYESVGFSTYRLYLETDVN